MQIEYKHSSHFSSPLYTHLSRTSEWFRFRHSKTSPAYTAARFAWSLWVRTHIGMQFHIPAHANSTFLYSRTWFCPGEHPPFFTNTHSHPHLLYFLVKTSHSCQQTLFASIFTHINCQFWTPPWLLKLPWRKQTATTALAQTAFQNATLVLPMLLYIPELLTSRSWSVNKHKHSFPMGFHS